MAAAGLLTDGEVAPLLARKITEATCAHFGYKKAQYKGQTVQVAPYYDADGRMVAQKIRTADKKFSWLGDPKLALPFGAQAFPKAGRMLVVTEGEIDAMAMSQVQQNKWPVVSIACGAGAQTRKYIAQHREYFAGFEKVVLMFDNDEPGREAARAASEVLGQRAWMAELPLKDAGEMLVQGRVDDMIRAMWNPTQHRPDGIVEFSTLKAKAKEGVARGLPWPWPTLTKLTYGRRTGEVYAFGAGTGVGKTDVFTQIVEQTVTELGLPVGVFFLEQSPTETAIRVAGKNAQKRLHIPKEDAGWTDDDFDAAWERVQGSGKLFLYDSFGNNDWEVIEERIRSLREVEGVRHFFIDHLTALAAWQDDERKALEIIMSSIGGIVKELDIAIYLISHLATPEGKPHEEGGRVMIRHFKGSRAIGFWCHYMFGLERDQQEEDMTERNTTTMRMLKDRYSGNVGRCVRLSYDADTGMLSESVVFGDDVTVPADDGGF